MLLAMTPFLADKSAGYNEEQKQFIEHEIIPCSCPIHRAFLMSLRANYLSLRA
jgi:hypothetical protein